MAEVWVTECASPLSPREAALRLAHEPGLAWLDGGLAHGRDGRFSFVSTAPCERVTQAAGEPWSALPSCELADDTRELRASDVPQWVGYVGYDARTPGASTPALCFARYDASYAFDHQNQRAYLVGDDAAACARLGAKLRRAPVDALAFEAGAVVATPWSEHEAAIRGALALIREGEVYEINLARRFRAPFAGSSLGLFLRMRDESPVPLGLYLEAGEHTLLGRSMERFLRLRDGVLSTSPIKGTVARLGDDKGEAQALSADPKERAEHAMVVDLMRNDLSRVCELGSVRIDELMAVLPFAGLSHLVSTISGRTDASVAEILAQTFPPGSITGAPKERVVRAIAQLESAARGLYCGCYGFLDRAGGCSFAVTIRSAVVSAGLVDYFAGGGIVADSDPAREVAETELKAQMFLRALSPSP
ncbi:MAG TPA: anthranilate synthase component I family protein [Polyangiales bacterium]|nr:anthranilate synthase component I family protein [Polyangiales bacterium]